jgi:hypothetical protein
MTYEHADPTDRWNDTVKGKCKASEKILPQYYFLFVENSTWAYPGINAGRGAERTETNRLSNSTTKLNGRTDRNLLVA